MNNGLVKGRKILKYSQYVINSFFFNCITFKRCLHNNKSSGIEVTKSS